MDRSTRALVVSVLAALTGGVLASLGFASPPDGLVQPVLILVIALLLVITVMSAFAAGVLYAPPISDPRKTKDGERHG